MQQMRQQNSPGATDQVTASDGAALDIDGIFNKTASRRLSSARRNKFIDSASFHTAWAHWSRWRAAAFRKAKD